jgi:hypothetical protein
MARRRLWWVGPPMFVGLVILISLDSIQWVFLARVQWVAWFALVILPALAHTLGRELLIGAYDLDNSRAGFHVGFLLVLVGTSIVDTAYITQKYGQERLREALGHVFLPSWGWILLGFVMIALNMGAALVATDPKRRTRILYGLIFGFLVGVGAWLLLDFVVSRRILFLLREADTISPVIHACFDWVKSMLSKLAVVLPRWISSGYFRLDKSIFVIEPGHIRAAVCFLATSLLYFWLRTKRLAPLCYFLLLMTVLVWGLSGLSFFLDAFRVPLFVPILLWSSVVAFHLKADHFYRICQEVSTKSDDCVTPSDPASILARATQSDDRIILVAAAGGGIQAAAWTARVLTGLEEMCAEKRPGIFARSLKLLSGVSGGSVGIMYFVTAYQLEGFLSKRSPENGKWRRLLQAVADVAKRSGLSEAIRGVAYTDFIRAIAPFCLADIYCDRGEGLERAWVSNANELSASYSNTLLRATLRGWQKDVARGALPAVIFNSTIVETGERLAFSTAPCGACRSKDGLATCATFQDFSSLYEGADIAITTAVRLSSTFPFISPAARPLPADSLPDGKPVADGPREASAIGRFTMNLHLADGGYYDNSGVAALVQWLHNGLRDLADRDLAKLPKEILVVRINAFPAAEQVYVREHRGAFFQFWAPLLAANTFRAATRACSADRELELLSERWSGEVLGRHNGKHRDGVRIQTVDLTFSASRTYGRKRSPLSWHLRKEERAEIENAWNTIRTGEQAQKVLAYLEPEKSKRLLPMGHHTSRFNIRFGRRIAGWDVSSKPWME